MVETSLASCSTQTRSLNEESFSLHGNKEDCSLISMWLMSLENTLILCSLYVISAQVEVLMTLKNVESTFEPRTMTNSNAMTNYII